MMQDALLDKAQDTLAGVKDILRWWAQLPAVGHTHPRLLLMLPADCHAHERMLAERGWEHAVGACPSWRLVSCCECALLGWSRELQVSCQGFPAPVQAPFELGPMSPEVIRRLAPALVMAPRMLQVGSLTAAGRGLPRALPLSFLSPLSCAGPGQAPDEQSLASSWLADLLLRTFDLPAGEVDPSLCALGDASIRNLLLSQMFTVAKKAEEARSSSEDRARFLGGIVDHLAREATEALQQEVGARGGFIPEEVSGLEKCMDARTEWPHAAWLCRKHAVCARDELPDVAPWRVAEPAAKMREEVCKPPPGSHFKVYMKPLQLSHFRQEDETPACLPEAWQSETHPLPPEPPTSMQVTSVAAPPKPPQPPQELSIPELHRRLDELHVSYAQCRNKKELEELLRTHSGTCGPRPLPGLVAQ